MRSMEKQERGFIVLIILTVILLSLPIIYPPILKQITGRATTQATTVSITITNTNPVVLSTAGINGSTQTITEGGTKRVTFYSVINDDNGASSINNVNATFFRSGESLRSNLSCILVSNLNSTAGNFSCTVGILWFDAAGLWDVNVTANDTSNGKTSPFNTSFTLSEATGMNATLSSITFASSNPDTFNTTSDNDPDTIQNTANKNNTQIQVEGINLLGDTDSITSIPAANFSVSIVTGSNLECTNVTLSNQTTTLVNNTLVSIANATLGRSATATRSLYFCIMHIPLNVTAQTYSTGGTPDEEDWTVGVV